MGEDRAFDLWRESDDFEMIMITSDKRLLISEGIADRFEPDSKKKDYSAEVIRR
jgi:thiamine biosynthesis lipoprotein